MKTNFEARLQEEMAVIDFEELSDASLDAKIDNWASKLDEGVISPEDALYSPTISFLDRLGFEVHYRNKRDPAEYVSFRSLYVDNSVAKV